MREVVLRGYGNQSVIIAEYHDVPAAIIAKRYLDGSTFQVGYPFEGKMMGGGGVVMVLVHNKGGRSFHWMICA
jgi:hypothetical protein